MAFEVHVCSSVGGAPILERLVDELDGPGRRATMYSLLSMEDYWGAASRLERWRLRGMLYAVYPARFLARFTGRGHPAVRVVTTNPFFMPYLAAIFCRSRHRRVVNLLYDLYPDAMEFAGVLSPKSWAARLLGRITAGAIRRCDATVFLGERLRKYTEQKYGPAPRAMVIPVGADGTPFRDCMPVQATDQTSVTILYCGNMGRLHDYRTIYEALQLVGTQKDSQGSDMDRGRRLEVAIHGNGVGFKKFQALAGADSGDAAWGLTFGENLSGDAWVEQMCDADIALVTMSKGAERVMMPSKAYSALVAGQAILAVCTDDSDLADLVRENECGWVVSPGDVSAMAEVLREIRSDPAGVLQKRQNAFRAGQEKYDLAVVAKKWLDLVNELRGDNPKA